MRYRTSNGLGLGGRLAVGALMAAAMGMAVLPVHATPLKVEYCVTTDEFGMNRYQFTVTLDNNDNSWFAGQGFNWFIVGDAQNSASPLADFVPELPLPAPFTDDGFSYSGGYHNGPTLLDFGTDFDFRGWVPEAIGDSFTFAGSSMTLLGPTELLWSNISSNNGAVIAEFLIATQLESCDGTEYCPADYDGNGGVDGGDVEAFFSDWTDGLPAADTNRDGGVDGADVETFFQAWEQGGC